MDNLIKNIKSNTMSIYTADYDNADNKLSKTVVNFGLQKGEMAIRSSGEYAGIIVMAEETIRPLLTDYRIAKALEFIKEEKLFEASRVLNADEVNKYGFDIVYYIINVWLERNKFEVPLEFTNKKIDFEANGKNILDDWIVTTRIDPLKGKIKIIDCGYSKEAAGPVLPEEWHGKTFNSAKQLHKEMDKLDWRRGKPPVTFGICYFMDLYEETTWSKIPNLKDVKPTLYLKVSMDNNTFKSEIREFKEKNSAQKWIDKLENEYKFVTYSYFNGDTLEELFIAVNMESVFESHSVYEKYENVGILSSRLQKCMRRGRGCAKLLSDTLYQLNKSKPYNLPQQQFAKVSGAKQLVWRLFISTIEDVAPFEQNDNGNYLSMQDILSLVVLCNVDPNLQFNQKMLNKIIFTALLILHNDGKGVNNSWRKKSDMSDLTINDTDSDILRSFKLALRVLPMKGGDGVMISYGIELLLKKSIVVNKLTIAPINELLMSSDKKLENRTILASYDMISVPSTILFIQSSLNKVPTNKYTTQSIPGIVWQISSGINIRNRTLDVPNEYLEFNELLLDVQSYLYNYEKYLKNLNNNTIINKITNKKYNPNFTGGKKLTFLESRVGFILVFGKEFKIKSKNSQYDVIICGDSDEPCRVKKLVKGSKEFVEGEERYIIEQKFAELLKDNYKIKLPDAPIGFKWAIKSNYVSVRIEIVSSDEKKFKNKLKFFVNDNPINAFDSSEILEPIPAAKSNEGNDAINEIISSALYKAHNNKYQHLHFNMLMRAISADRLSNGDFTVYSWRTFGNVIPFEVWRSIIVKFNTAEDSRINIGPVDAWGNKLQYSIDYMYEGTFWRIFNFLSMMYPRTVKTTSSDLIFTIDKNTPEYSHLNNSLIELTTQITKFIDIPKTPPLINTKLWEHQRKTVEKITYNILKLGRMGQGDASSVGAGKTLCALAIICNLMTYNIKNKIGSHYAALVLLPTEKLYKTWIDEITTHTEGFNYITQNANGSLSGTINYNTILITTLGRMRDHPLNVPWIYCVVDECLTIQNKNALWTGEAWRQSSASQYGCLLLSATFFRSRIDKLYYMLKMLKTGLPEERSYLSAILSETIIVNVPVKTRKWITNINKLKLDRETRKKYDELLNQKLTSEQLYVILNKFIYDNVDYISLFENKLLELNAKKKRVLMYARSKEEADKIAKLKNVGRFPDISKRNVVGTVAECAHGINTLVVYNCILMRPQNPEILQQILGRLDRPKQKENTLYLEYILLENTVEEANLLVLELANKFRKNFILPLADYYDLAVGKKGLSDIN